jgi:hypothetical protein
MCRNIEPGFMRYKYRLTTIYYSNNFEIQKKNMVDPNDNGTLLGHKRNPFNIGYLVVIQNILGLAIYYILR